jgi:hypothetical protein
MEELKALSSKHRAELAQMIESDQQCGSGRRVDHDVDAGQPRRETTTGPAARAVVLHGSRLSPHRPHLGYTGL